MKITITMYELLGLIKDGKAPKRIKYDRYTYWFCETAYHRENGGIISGEYLGEDFRLDLCLNDEVEIIEDKPSEEIRKLQSEIDILTNKVEHYYSEVVSFRDKTRYLKDELKKLKERK